MSDSLSLHFLLFLCVSISFVTLSLCLCASFSLCIGCAVSLTLFFNMFTYGWIGDMVLNELPSYLTDVLGEQD